MSVRKNLDDFNKHVTVGGAGVKYHNKNNDYDRYNFRDVRKKWQIEKALRK